MNAIDVYNVSFEYTKGSSVVKDISFSVPEKKTTMLIGPNGSGKTTLLKLMVGLIKPGHGSIHIYGHKPKEKRNLIGYVPQKLYFDQAFPVTVMEFLQLAYKGSKQNILDILENVGMKGFGQSRIGALSGGQLQRILIARSLLGKPKILFLDEPLSGIDIEGEQNFYDLIKKIQKEHNVTIVMVSHEVHIVSKVADQVICINKEMLCAGEPSETLSPKVMEQLYGKETSLYNHQCN